MDSDSVRIAPVGDGRSEERESKRDIEWGRADVLSISVVWSVSWPNEEKMTQSRGIPAWKAKASLFA